MRWTRRGIGLNALLEVLNEAKEPLTLRQLVHLVIEKLYMPSQDEKAIKLCVASFNNRLRKCEGRSVMVIEDNPNRWLAIRATAEEWLHITHVYKILFVREIETDSSYGKSDSDS